MFPNFLRLLLTLIILTWSGYQFFEENIGNGIFFFLLSGIVLLTYFKNELILWTLVQLRGNKMDKAERTLSKIKNPDSGLTKRQCAYYYYLKGVMSSQKDAKSAEKFLRKSISLGLKGDNDLAMAKLSLAGIAMSKRRKREATNLLAEANKLDKKGVLKEQMNMLKKQLKRI